MNHCHCSNEHATDENALSIPVYSFSWKERTDKEKQEKHWKQKIDLFQCFSIPFHSQITPKQNISSQERLGEGQKKHG